MKHARSYTGIWKPNEYVHVGRNYVILDVFF